MLLRADRRCDEAWLRYLEDDLPVDPSDRAVEIDRRLDRARWPRYQLGWRRYLDAIGPVPASIDIDNNDLAAPIIAAG